MTELDPILAALADPTRRQVIELLSDGREMTMTDVTKNFDMSRQAVGKHLGILKDAGMRIISRRAKWFLNRRLINAVGVTLARGVAVLDRLMQRTAPDYGWDVFVVAEKVGQSGGST